ncbi:MAG: hypothetical protein R3Y65_05135 [Bacillota bacterium]
MLIAIVAISYILAINVFGFRIVKIQRADRLKNGDPIHPPAKQNQLSAGKTATAKETDIAKEKETADIENCKNTAKKESEKLTKTKHSTSREKATPPQHPNNGETLEKEDLLYEEKLNIKKYERIPDLKILMVAVFGGALGEFISFLIYKYRTTNTFLMVALPVIISVWVYLVYILVGGFIIV